MVRRCAGALLALAAALAPAAGRAADLEIRRDFELRAEGGTLALRDDQLTLHSPSAPPQSLRLSPAGARPSPSHLPREEATPPALCDPLDQLDLSRSHPALRAVLPPAARLKAVLERGGATLAVYALPSERSHYEVWLGLLARDAPGTARLLKMKRVSQGGGYLCGAWLVGPAHVVVLVREPAQAADRLVAYGLTVR
jgi:hypothetical protein